MDDATRAAYERGAATYDENRSAARLDDARRLVEEIEGDERPILDLGCGTGSYLEALAEHRGAAIGSDGSLAMLARAKSRAAKATLAAAAHAALPFRDAAFGAVWSRHSCVHTSFAEMPMVLRSIRRVLSDGGRLAMSLIDGPTEPLTYGHDDLPGRTFYGWEVERLTDVAIGAGFSVDRCERQPKVLDGREVADVWLEATRVRSIADTVGADMRLLVCGLNPSLHAADAGCGFVTPGNRFWPAAIEAGLASVDRDPEHALAHHGLGMTDLVKRATPRAAELTAEEYRDGIARVERLCERLRPGAVCFVGLAGWRAAMDRKATAGPQDRRLGGRPVYVMPSTSGLNASSQHPDFVAHFRAALALTDPSSRHR